MKSSLPMQPWQHENFSQTIYIEQITILPIASKKLKKNPIIPPYYR
jgi:hypothetical protein